MLSVLLMFLDKGFSHESENWGVRPISIKLKLGAIYGKYVMRFHEPSFKKENKIRRFH